MQCWIQCLDTGKVSFGELFDGEIAVVKALGDLL